LLTTFGVPWTDARHLTISFVPDGTLVDGQKSNVFAKLNAQGDTAVWQAAILKAFQTWAANANVNVGVVPDNGEPLGTPGKTEGDPRFGDIRIAARPMADSALSVSVPHDPFMSGTWAGDVLLNSNIDYRSSQSDLFSVMLHEAGHVFGLGGSDDPHSVMYENDNGVRSALASSDVAAIEALYGQRSPDANEGSNGNDSFSTPTQLQPSGGGSGGSSGGGSNGSGSTPGGSAGSTSPLIAFGDVTTASDVDDFAWQLPSNISGPVTFRLQTAGLSLLEPELSIFDSSGKMLATAESTNAAGDVLTINLSSVVPNTTIFLKVQAATSGVMGIGRYGLAVIPGGETSANAAAIDAVLRGPYDTLPQGTVDQLLQNPNTVLFNNDAGTNDTLNTAVTLATTPGYAKETHYEVLGSLGNATDVDFYRIKAASVSNGQPNVLTVTMTSLASNGALAQVALYDNNGNVVSSQILANGDGTYTIQAENLKSGGDYFLRASADTSSGQQIGNYSLVASFGGTAEQVAPFLADSITTPSSVNTSILYVAQEQLFQFLLSASSSAGNTGGIVTMNITHGSGNLVFSLTVIDGQVASGNSLLLDPGQYVLTFTGSGITAPLSYSLSGIVLSDPLGPGVNDPTLDPTYTTPSTPGVYYYPPPPVPAYLPPIVTTTPYLFLPWPGYPYLLPPI
jgi:hypothetical protein